MSHRLSRLMRRFSPLLAAGVLLQTGSCAANMNELLASLAGSIANELITGIVFGFFNLANY